MPQPKSNTKDKSKKKDEVYSDFTMPVNILAYATEVIHKSIQLGKQYQEFRYKRNDWRYQSNENLETFAQWLPFYQQACDIDLLKGELEFMQLTSKSNLSHAPTIEHFFKSYNFFGQHEWPARFSSRLVGKYTGLPLEQKKFFVGLVSKLLHGYIFDSPTEVLSISDAGAYTKFFSTMIGKSDRYLLWMVGVERVPKLSTNRQTVQKFEYVHYMRFIDIVSGKELSKGGHVLACNRTIYDFRRDPARQDFGYIQPIYTRSALFQEAETLTGTVPEFLELRVPNAKYTPNRFKGTTLSEREKSSIIYDPTNQRWRSGVKAGMFENEQYNDYVSKLNKDTINDKANFKNASQIVEFLKKIPNFRIKLTEEQNQVVGQAENVVALGRSGTGKTTCAILRLFAMEIMFKFRMTLAKVKHEGSVKSNFGAEDIDNIYGLHCIFVTASPVLSNEVQRYYHRLTDQVKEELKKKQKRILDKKREEEKQKKEEELKAQQEQEKNPDEIIEAHIKEQAEEAVEALKLAEEGIKDIVIDEPNLDNNDEELIDEEEADNEIIKNMQKLNSLRHVKEDSFPMFLTVKRLVLLIDGSLSRPFFARNIKDQIIGLDSNAQWHNEVKGVMMIGNYHRKMKNFDKTIKKAEDDQESDIESSGSEEEEEELEEEEFKAEYQREMNLKARANKNDPTSRLKNNHYKLSFEIEYEYFVSYFWNPIVMKKMTYVDLHPIVVWSEIQSHIKGSANSHLYPGLYLPERVYYSMDSQKKNFLNKEKKSMIFDIFGRYERWKREIGAYDFMDVVNYVLNHIRFYGYAGVPIHYLMIDEVQDLTHATILLFMKITNMGLFFSGDTAQTIAKGVGMRFSDLRSLFKINEVMYFNSYHSNTWKQPIIKQLTVNFRSHGKILELANSVVTVIETFFPRTIDKLKKEKSEIDGPKPILLADLDLDVLFTLLFGAETYKSARHSENKGSIVGNQVEFGCNQVIIVRDQESKEKLPPLLKHALVLTVYEAKGLEFDDVILYNFFSDSTITNTQWKLLETLAVQDIQLDEFEYNQMFFTFNQEKKSKKQKKKEAAEKAEEKKEEKEQAKKEQAAEDDDEDDDEEEDEKLNQDSVQLFNSSLDITTHMYTIKKVTTSISRKNFDINPYSLLCTELKQLYVAITRPKNRLIIYDESIQNRKFIENYWRKLDLVEVVSKKDLDSSMSVSTNKELASFKSLVTKTNASEWKKQGVRMFKNKYYEQAMKCFEKSGDEELRLRSAAYHSADKASSKMSDVNAKKMYLKQNLYPYNTYTKTQKKAMNTELKAETVKCRKHFLEAGQNFEQIGLLKQAAQCYFSAEKYKKALNAYEKIGFWKQAAEAAFMVKDFELAAHYYDRGGDYIRTIECLAEIKQYEKVLEIIDKYKEIPTEQREKFAKKYVPLALKSLVVNIDYNIEDLEEKKKEEQKEKIKRQYRDYKIEEVSEDEEEDDEDEEEEDEDEDEQEEEEKAEGEGEEKKNILETEGLEEKQEANNEEEKEAKPEAPETQIAADKANVSDLSFTEGKVEKSAATAKDQTKNVSDMSFEVINGDGKSKDVSIISFNDDSIKPKDFKPKDKANVDNMSFEEVGSINIKATVRENIEDFDHLSHIDPEDEWLRMETGSIVEKLSAIRRQDSASYSDYSALDFNHVMNNQGTLVKTKTDIFVQDSIMQKIIRFIGMFSEDVKQSLGKVRSKKTLLSQKSPAQMSDESVIDLIVDLDEISTDFIYLILDLLEHYKLYKLCIFVCNRYGLSQKLGRYLVNIASKYSNFASESIAINKIRLLNNVQRQIQNEKAFVAGIAFHNVLENINPNFLRLKKKDELVDFTNSLGNECYSELINLGFWKKCMFLMDYNNSLALASTFASFKNYKLIYLKEDESKKTENINSLLANENFEFLPFKTPSTPEEMSCCFVALEAVTWDLAEKFPIYLQRDTLTDVVPASKLELPPFASFFAFNGILWNYIYNKSSENAQLFENYLADAVVNLVKILKNPDFKSSIIELRIYDLITFFIQLNLLYTKVPEIQDSLLNFSDSKFEDLISIFNNLLVMTDNILKTSKFQETIIRALITPYRIRPVEKCEVLEHMSNSYYVVHISSPLVNEIITYGVKDGVQDPLYASEMIDIEGNFIASPINVVLNVIRKRLVSTMKNLVNGRIKSIIGHTYDESAERVERYIHIIGLIECYRFAINYTETGNQSNSMYKKMEGSKDDAPIFAQIKNELKQRYVKREEIQNDESYAPEEKEILVAGVEKEIRKLKEFMKKKAIKLDNEPFEQQKIHYFKAIKRNCRSIKNTQVRMNPFVRQALLSYLFSKVSVGFMKNKLSFNYVNLFYLLGEEIYLNEIIRKHKKNPYAKTIQLYSDALLYRRFYCVDDYANNLFEYISTVYSSLKVPQKISLLQDIAPMIIVATALKDKKKVIKLDMATIEDMEDLDSAGQENVFVLKKNILPVETEDAIHELAHWLEKISLGMLRDVGNYGEVELKKHISALTRMILDLIANKEDMDLDTVKKIKYAIKNIADSGVAEEIKVLFKYQTPEDFTRLSKELTTGKVSLKSKLGTVNIESNLKKAEQEYEKCDQTYLKDQVLISKHINLKKAILKFYNKNRFARIKAKINFNAMEHNYLLVTFKNLADREFIINNIFHFVKKNSALLQLFYEINNFLKKAMHFFFFNKLDNPLDFHYIMSLLHNLARIGAGYVEFIRELTISKDFTPEKNKQFVTRKVEFTDLEKEFDKWVHTIEVKEDLTQQLRKKKIIGVKWEERAFKSVLTNKSKQKKGAKRQQLLQEKKDRIKGK